MVENIIHDIKFAEANQYYNVYGLDVEGRKEEEYLDYYSFRKKRDHCNKLNTVESQTILLRDKLLFYKYMISNNLPVADVLCIMKNGRLLDTSLNEVDIEYLKDKKDFFVKDIAGECASFVKRISNYKKYQEIEPDLQEIRGGVLYQSALVQCEKLNQLNPNAINTLRVVTVLNNGKAKVLGAILRVGTRKTGNVDNWAAGGLAIGIKDDGYLKEFAFYKPSYGLKVDRHPDTGIIFSQFQIPMYKEVLDLACRAHETFYGIHSIGWDIALTVDGPVFIEGNDNWELGFIQVCHGGIRKEWEELSKKYT